MYLVTPFICKKTTSVTLISKDNATSLFLFANISSRTNHCFGWVMRSPFGLSSLDRPDLAKKKAELIKQQNEFKVRTWTWRWRGRLCIHCMRRSLVESSCWGATLFAWGSTHLPRPARLALTLKASNWIYDQSPKGEILSLSRRSTMSPQNHEKGRSYVTTCFFAVVAWKPGFWIMTPYKDR